MASQSTTATLSQLMQTYYDKLFIKTAKHWLIHEQGAQMRPLPQSEGKLVSFQRYSALDLITATMTEGSNPDAVTLSATNVTATVGEYGSYTTLSKLLKLTAIDPKMQGAVEVMAQNAGESIDQLVRNELDNGTVQFTGSKSLISDIAASDVLGEDEIRKAVRTLKVNKAMRYPDGYFLGKVNPYTSFDIMGETVWVNAHTYKDGDNLYRGELGKLHGVRFIETTNPKSTSSTVTVYHNYIHGAEAFGITQLSGDEKKIYVKVPGANSTDNPIDRFSTVGWAVTFVPKVIDANWIIVVKSGVTA
jgi:N4-gp56 family major capsid protein